MALIPWHIGTWITGYHQPSHVFELNIVPLAEPELPCLNRGMNHLMWQPVVQGTMCGEPRKRPAVDLQQGILLEGKSRVSLNRPSH